MKLNGIRRNLPLAVTLLGLVQVVEPNTGLDWLAHGPAPPPPPKDTEDVIVDHLDKYQPMQVPAAQQYVYQHQQYPQQGNPQGPPVQSFQSQNHFVQHDALSHPRQPVKQQQQPFQQQQIIQQPQFQQQYPGAQPSIQAQGNQRPFPNNIPQNAPQNNVPPNLQSLQGAYPPNQPQLETVISDTLKHPPPPAPAPFDFSNAKTYDDFENDKYEEQRKLSEKMNQRGYYKGNDLHPQFQSQEERHAANPPAFYSQSEIQRLQDSGQALVDTRPKDFYKGKINHDPLIEKMIQEHEERQRLRMIQEIQEQKEKERKRQVQAEQETKLRKEQSRHPHMFDDPPGEIKHNPRWMFEDDEDFSKGSSLIAPWGVILAVNLLQAFIGYFT